LYALGPKQGYGWANPKEWTFATEAGADGKLTMLSDEGTKELVPNRQGYSHINADDGFQVTVNKTSGGAHSVHIRTGISFDKDSSNVDSGGDEFKFKFEGQAPQPFPVTFTIRDMKLRGESIVLWSKSFTVNGDWKPYTATIPRSAITGPGKTPFLVMAGHLGGKTGAVSLRHIYLK